MKPKPKSERRRTQSPSGGIWRNAHALRSRAALVLAVVCLLSGYGRAQHTEYEVKAVYLYQFGRFVHWPDTSGNNFPICVLGYDPFGPVLDSTVDGESLEGKKLSVRRVSSAQQAADCRILFVSSSEQHRLESIFSALSDKPVLTVSDIGGFCDRGGMIQFVLEGERVRFEVNRAAAERVGLTFSSDLLRVAMLVKNNRPGP